MPKKNATLLALVFTILLSLPGNMASAASCKLFGNLKSRNSGVPVTIRFRNRSNGYRVIEWLNYKGQPVTYKHLQAGQSYTQQTYAGHPWMITDGPGNCRQIFVPGNRSRVFNIVR